MATYKYFPYRITDAVSGEQIMPDRRKRHVLIQVVDREHDDLLTAVHYLTPTDARDLGIKLIELAYSVVGDMVSEDLRRGLKVAPAGDASS